MTKNRSQSPSFINYIYGNFFDFVVTEGGCLTTHRWWHLVCNHSALPNIYHHVVTRNL